MTLPTGQISMSQINVELGQSASYSSTLSWVNSLVKPAQRPAQPNLNTYRGMAYYKRNQDGNCNNSSVNNCNCNCGNINCTNCLNCTNINCANCDAQNWLQTNCNCACTYNCTSSSTSYNCDCDCDCACDCVAVCDCVDCACCWYC